MYIVQVFFTSIKTDSQRSSGPNPLALKNTKLCKESGTEIQEEKLRTLDPLQIKQILLLPSFEKLLRPQSAADNISTIFLERNTQID